MTDAATDTTDDRALRRLRNLPQYRAAEQKAREYIERIRFWLTEDGFAYAVSDNQTGLYNLGGADVTITVRPALVGETATPDGETICVRIFGPRPNRVIYYANNVKTARHNGRLYGRLRTIVHRAQGALKRRQQPTVQQANEARCQIARRSFSTARILSGCQARIDLPGGARMDITGEKEHDVFIRNLTSAQLETICRAIAATLQPEHRSEP